MSIEKKSLISNRTATKKALVTKPQVSKVAPARTANVAKLGHTYISARVGSTSRIKI